ncbi:DoxX family protein [Nocardioides sp.]|uniref:DoxX family protein n=1 Tax=Nocardioides sp. TaxID=35761 RepID=UPI003514FFC5
MSLPLTAKAVTGAFAVSGVIHLVKPEVFEPLVPEQLPGGPRPWVVWSGVAELACAAGLAVPATRRPAAVASAALLAGVFPGNVKMALDAQRSSNTAFKAGTLARLPLQWPMIRSMLKVARES